MVAKCLPEIVDVPENTGKVSVELNEDTSKIQTNVKSTGLKSISFDLLGDLKVFNGGLDPKYSVIKTETTLQLDVEICGPFYAIPKDSERHILTCETTKFSLMEMHGKIFK